MAAWRVGIVGGGPGGLMAAYCLQKQAAVPYTATIFEASSRVGGKILTDRFSLAPATYEAGAAEFYDYSPVDDDSLKELVAELGLTITPMRGSSVIVNGHILSNLQDIHDQLGPEAGRALADFDRMARDRITPHEFYRAGDWVSALPQPESRFDEFLTAVPQPAARRYIETMIHSDLATEPPKTSTEYGLHNYLMNHPAYMQLYSIVGGNELLPRTLAARLHAITLLEHTVTDIAKGNGGRLRIASTHEGKARTDEFDFVIVAVPNDYLPAITFHGDRLSVAMTQHHAHYDHPAHYLRITILFDRPFWRGTLPEAYCMLDRFGGCCLYDESAREPGATHAVLGWLLGGEAALEMSRWNDDQLIEAALDSLPPFVAHGRQYFMEGRVHRWIGAVNAMPGGRVPRSLDQRHQPEPKDHPNLFVVGDYLFDSTLNGVLDSAEYVAAWVAAVLAESFGVRA
jgi:monoamine oxidase